jgi:hypothetical protein
VGVATRGWPKTIAGNVSTMALTNTRTMVPSDLMKNSRRLPATCDQPGVTSSAAASLVFATVLVEAG